MQFQFNVLCGRLEKCADKDKDSFSDSKELIKLFLNTSENLFVDIEIVMHITCCAAVKLATESVVESLVSRFERQCHKGRGRLLESTREDLMEISCNGPNLPECHDVVEKSMDRAWGGKKWHFNRTYDIREMFKDSKVLERMKKEKSALPFMV